MDNTKSPVGAIMFDLDGTLIDSIGIYVKIVKEVFERLKLPPVSTEIVFSAIKAGNFNWENLLPDEAKDRKEEIVNSALLMIRDIYPDRFRKEIKLIPGTDEVLKKIFNAGIKIGIVTSTHQKHLKYKLDPLARAGVCSLVEAIVAIEDVTRVKPDPEPLMVCSERLGVPAASSIYVGDTCIDILAGKAAGTKTIAVLTGVGDYGGLKAEKPDHIIDSISEIQDVVTLNTIGNPNAQKPLISNKNRR